MIKTIKIALTGGIGSGKSFVLKMISDAGVPVLQTDLIGHKFLNDKKVKMLLAKRFGEKIFKKNGMVNRRELAVEVFRNARNRNKINELLHPAIRKKVSDWITEKESKHYPFVVVEVPLLFERGYNQSFDKVLSVSAPKDLRWKRLLKRGWGMEEIRKRENAQWPQTRKNKKADWVIFNRSTRKDLKYIVGQWMRKVEKMSDGQSENRQP